jgi:hypothetical protein
MKKKTLTLLILTFSFILYISSYIVIRENSKIILEKDGYPPEVIAFPADGFFHIYRPLIGIEIILGNRDFCRHGKGCM